MVDFAKLLADRSSRPVPPAPPRFAATAERTFLGHDPSGANDRTTEVQVYLWVDRKADGSVWIQLDGGPTGYESFQATEANIRAMQTKNWIACMGTRGRWDRLMVPVTELRRFFGWAGLGLSEVA